MAQLESASVYGLLELKPYFNKCQINQGCFLNPLIRMGPTVLKNYFIEAPEGKTYPFHFNNASGIIRIFNDDLHLSYGFSLSDPRSGFFNDNTRITVQLWNPISALYERNDTKINDDVEGEEKTYYITKNTKSKNEDIIYSEIVINTPNTTKRDSGFILKSTAGALLDIKAYKDDTLINRKNAIEGYASYFKSDFSSAPLSSYFSVYDFGNGTASINERRSNFLTISNGWGDSTSPVAVAIKRSGAYLSSSCYTIKPTGLQNRIDDNFSIYADWGKIQSQMIGWISKDLNTRSGDAGSGGGDTDFHYSTDLHINQTKTNTNVALQNGIYVISDPGFVGGIESSAPTTGTRSAPLRSGVSDLEDQLVAMFPEISPLTDADRYLLEHSTSLAIYNNKIYGYRDTPVYIRKFKNDDSTGLPDTMTYSSSEVFMEDSNPVLSGTDYAQSSLDSTTNIWTPGNHTSSDTSYKKLSRFSISPLMNGVYLISVIVGQRVGTTSFTPQEKKWYRVELPFEGKIISAIVTPVFDPDIPQSYSSLILPNKRYGCSDWSVRYINNGENTKAIDVFCACNRIINLSGKSGNLHNGFSLMITMVPKDPTDPALIY